MALQQQPQSSSQPLLRLLPQPLQPQLLLLPQPLLFQPPQQQKRMISRMIHQEPLPPQPLFPQHIVLHLISFAPGPFSPRFCTILWPRPVPGDRGGAKNR